MFSVPGYVVNGCPLGGQNPVQRIRTVLEAQLAEDRMTNHVITLTDLEDAIYPTPDTVSFPVGNWKTFFCEVAKPELAERVVWRHHNATIHGSAVPPSPKGHYYRQTTIENISYLFIHNVSRGSGGTVECLMPCAGDLCHLRTYYLQSELRARDIFVPPMRNVSTPLWSSSMTCNGSVDCSQTQPVSLFIWKYDGYFVAAPYSDLLGWPVPGLLNGSVTFDASTQGAPDPYCASTLTITMREEASPRSARVDCWMRTDVRSREWLAQSAHVHFAQLQY
ncbi:uncharacterized protein LOC129600692 [Paramacrobiotus metropolitanus]|uniref:uncharacterized protein LOC129600692 n=1 Tax=Paramacrobiotus metropolitanus TaxID=2943436 RepID=UPI002445EEC3|nr:uncharacterized protein LOC129600692 [Paramacrobiotus metropolitanus]XP_055355225.1 uncharacterized protein LOC129600692 [Paramacrobiotus metropolitanus]